MEACIFPARHLHRSAAGQQGGMVVSYGYHTKLVVASCSAKGPPSPAKADPRGRQSGGRYGSPGKHRRPFPNKSSSKERA